MCGGVEKFGLDTTFKKHECDHLLFLNVQSSSRNIFMTLGKYFCSERPVCYPGRAYKQRERGKMGGRNELVNSKALTQGTYLHSPSISKIFLHLSRLFQTTKILLLVRSLLLCIYLLFVRKNFLL